MPDPGGVARRNGGDRALAGGGLSTAYFSNRQNRQMGSLPGHGASLAGSGRADPGGGTIDGPYGDTKRRS
jgi:hypothetical protein